MAGLTRGAQLFRTSTVPHLRRHFAATGSTSAQAQLDPIQKLFLDKIQDYKKMTATGKPPGWSDKQLEERLDRIRASYGADKEDMSKFPAVQFAEAETEFVDYEEKMYTLEECQEEVEALTAQQREKNKDVTVRKWSGGLLKKDIWEKQYAPKHQQAGVFEKPKWH